MAHTPNPSNSDQAIEPGNSLNQTMERIRQSSNLQETLETTVLEIQRFLKVDRVKVYRFAPDGTGEVIAESIQNGQLPTLKGLHFPASDIPPQARNLLIQAQQRVVIDVVSQRKTLSRHNPFGTGTTSSNADDIRYSPVDICHLKYLNAMGVAASLTVPILYQNQLWGLLAAHHTQPRSFSEPELQIVQILVDHLPIAIAQSELFEQTRQQALQETAISELNALLHSGEAVAELRQAALEQITKSLQATGGRLYLMADPTGHPAQIYTWGEQPEGTYLEEQIAWQQFLGWQALAPNQRWAEVQCCTIADWAQDQALQPLTVAFESTRIKSLLVVPLQYQQQQVGCLTLFRSEFETSRLWAGRWSADERNRKPRQSFEAWREQQVGQTPQWTAGEMRLAQALGLRFYISVIQQRVESLLRQHNSHDLLTGLPNRLLCEELLSLSLVNLHQQGRMLAVILLDLDRFKTINDTLGHAVGDRLLQQVSERLKTCLKEGDTLARWGNDEFTLLLPIQCADDAVQVAQTLLMMLSHPFRVDKQEFHLTASIGVALAPYDGGDAETLLKHADATLNRSKQQGQNNYLLYTPVMNTLALERLVLGNSLYRAIDQQQFLLHYQPQVDLKTGQIIGMEALVRWQHPEIGLVSPQQFIPLAEETGLICAIGEWVLQTACAQNRAWQVAGLPPIRIAVNLSAKQFQQQDLVPTIVRILRETKLEPHYLELEITESLVMQDMGYAITALRELQALGVSIAIDDFGTGYSSLASLMHFPLNALKIDRSFVQCLIQQTSNVAIVTAIISLGHGLNLKLIAEGVETVEQLEFLRLANCDVVQGYWFSQPLPLDQATQFLQQKFSRTSQAALSTAQALIPLPQNERQRVAALRQYQILDTPAEAAFDDLTHLAAQICQTPFAWISFVDEERQWLKSRFGIEITETPRSIAFCAHTILHSTLWIIPDTIADPRFANHPFVLSSPHLRFYAAMPLIDQQGFAIGALCVADRVPRTLNAEQQSALRVLAQQVITKLELRRNRFDQQQLEEKIIHAQVIEIAQQAQDKTSQIAKDTEPTLIEQVQLAQVMAQFGSILSKREPLSVVLQACADALIEHLEIAVVTIWILNPATNQLEIQVVAEQPNRGCPPLLYDYKVQSIFKTGRAFYTNQLNREPDIDKALDLPNLQEFAAFAGYPLTVAQGVTGVITLFARNFLSDATQITLAAITDGIARYIEHQQTEDLLRQQAQRERLVTTIAQRIRQSLDLDEILNTTVQEVRHFLQTDRVVIFRFKPNWVGVVTVESVAEGWKPILRSIIDEPCFRNAFVTQYQQGRVRAIEDIYTAGITDCHLQLLAEFQVRANLVVPILQGDHLWGLLIAHHCSGTRHWRQIEINLLSQLATQVAIAIQQAELYQQVQRLATIDALTQLANRRRFEEYFQDTWQQMSRAQSSLSLILCDIDFFKAYNDTYGHPAGDTCLRAVAAAIDRGSNRAGDLVARYGGEEFAIVLPNTDLAGAMLVGSRLRAEVNRLKLPHCQSPLSQYVTVSVGVSSLIPTTNQSKAVLLSKADQALYQAKAQGRDRVVSS
ncbi:MAG TPA: diguanylate cyclase [Trichocoleus sp.]|jgi:diguanylate cyclase (GGDEF)-like protein